MSALLLLHADCIPLFTINSGIALRYGIESCVKYVAKVIRAFHDAGLMCTLRAVPHIGLGIECEVS